MPRHAAHFRLKLRGPVYQVRFTRNKQEHRLSTETGDYQRAKQEAARLVLEHDAAKICKLCGGGGAAVGPQPIDRLSEAFLKAVLRTHGAAYQKRATTDMVQYIEKRWTDPNEITSKAWEEWKIELHNSETERRDRLSWGSIANLANTLRAFLRFCAGVGAVGADVYGEPLVRLKNPDAKQLAGDRAYLRPLDEDEQAAFLWALALAGEGRALRIYVALFETWVRKGALEAMTPRWINFPQERLTVPSKHTKAQRGDTEHDVNPHAMEAIRAQMEENAHAEAEAARTGTDQQGDNGERGAHHRPLFRRSGSAGGGCGTSGAGDLLSAGPVLRDREVAAGVVQLDKPIFGKFDYRYLFPRIAEAAGIDLTGLTAHHVTRRTAATLAGEKPGASLAGLKAQGGWRSSAVVDRYMRPSVEAARKVTR